VAKLKNISGEARDVPLLAELEAVEVRVVEPGETVTVPDEVLTEFVWPATTWEVVADAPAAKATATAKAKGE